MFIKNIFIPIMLLCSGLGIGQSCFIQNFNLPDGSSRTVPLVISGATSTLAQDQICKITFKLKHESINQLRIRLISPSGQSVLLLGPADATSNTIFPTPTYNISLVRCTDTPAPEPGYDARWRNNQTWIGNTFSGTYFPNTGCLSDFNTGPINGVWQLQMEDVARFDAGVIECFSIEFCNSPNVRAASCDDRSGRLLVPDATICSYDSLRLVPITDFPSGRPSAALYSNRYVVMSGTEIVRYVTDTIKNLQVGTYTVCQFLVANDDLQRLPPVGSLISNANFALEFARLNLCGGVSPSCMSLTINPIPATFKEPVMKLCKGSTLSFKGRIIDTAGNYRVFVPSTVPSICDTLYEVTVEEIDLRPLVNASSLTLLCGGTVTLTNGTLGMTPSAVTTFSGPGIVNRTASTAIINRQGRYQMQLVDQGCTDTTSIFISGDPNLPRLTFVADTITCLNPNATISINTSRSTITGTTWSSGTNLSINSVRTNQAGKLVATVTHADGCVVADSTTVSIDIERIKPIIQLAMPNLTCRIRTIDSDIPNANLFNPNFVNKLNDTIVFNNRSLSRAGTYKIIGQLSRNGCIDSSSVVVNDFKEDPIVTLESVCDASNKLFVRANVSVIHEINREVGQQSWVTSTGMGNPIGLTQEVNTPGLFSFSYISTTGCRSNEDSITINIASAYPTFSISDDSLACDKKTITFNQPNMDPNATYVWTGPNNYTSSDASPVVNTIGRYIGQASYPSGCFKRDTANVVLKLNETPFDLTTIVNIVCEDTLELQPTDRVKYTYNWRTDISPSIVGEVNDTLFTINPGTYILEVFQGGDICYNIPVRVGDERDIPVLSPEKIDITCDPTSQSGINLNPNNPLSIDTIQWTGPSGFQSGNLNISNLAAGVYRYLIRTNNGCNLRDSFEIMANTNRPRISLSQDSIILTCDDYTSGIGEAISVITTDPISSYTWTRDGDATVLSTNANLSILKDGIFTVRVIGSNQCVSTITARAIIDTVNAGLVRMDVIPKTCLNPFPTLTPIHPNGFRSLNVLFDNGTLVSNANSFIATKGGVYTLQSIDNRGCASTDVFTIVDQTDSVRIQNTIRPIGCEPGAISLRFLNTVQGISWIGNNNDTLSRDSSLSVTIPGRYFVHLESPLGCKTIDSFQVVIDAAIPVLVSEIFDTITCNQPNVDIAVNVNRPIRSVDWKFNQADTTTSLGNLSVSKPGKYIWTVTSNNGCTLTDSLEVPIDTLSPRYSFQKDTLTCQKPFTVVRASTNIGLSQYLWEGPNNFVSRDSIIRIGFIGSYKLTAKSRNGCQSSDSTRVVENKIFPKLTIPDTLNLPCTNDSLLVRVTSDQPLRDQRWVSSRALLSRASDLRTRATGIIRVFVISQEGCQAEDSVFVFQDTSTTRAKPIGNNITCNPDTAFLRANITSPYRTLKWITPSGTEINNFTNIASQDSGIFRLVVERLPLCLDTFPVFINADRVKPTLTVTQLNPIKCEVRESVLLGEASHFRRNALIYTWTSVTGNILGSNRLNTIRVNKAATYTFRAIDTVNNCSEVAFISVSEDDADLDTFNLQSQSPRCFAANDGSLTITNVVGGTAPYGISLSRTNLFAKDTVIRNLRAGRYNVFLRDSFGCVKSTFVTLADGQKPFVTLPDDLTVTLGTSININFITDIRKLNIKDIIWRASNGLACDNCENFMANPEESIDLLILITNDIGCVAQDSMKINVLPIINWVFPNILSLSSSENSSISLPENKGVERVDNWIIYDRWGNLIWQAQSFKPGDTNAEFDPRKILQNIESGVYVMKIEATLINGAKWQRIKDFTIVK